jgi:plasmid stability protein
MSHLLIPDVEPALLDRLRERASRHGRTVEMKAMAILAQALESAPQNPWAGVNAIRERLAASGRDFGDSTEMLREDRQR